MINRKRDPRFDHTYCINKGYLAFESDASETQRIFAFGFAHLINDVAQLSNAFVIHCATLIRSMHVFFDVIRFSHAIPTLLSGLMSLKQLFPMNDSGVYFKLVLGPSCSRNMIFFNELV